MTRTKVGGLIDPDIERIISLKPDLVVVYGTQTDLRAQLERAQIPIFLYQHSGLADITGTIRALGARIGSEKASETSPIASRPRSQTSESASPEGRGRERCSCSAATRKRFAASMRAAASGSSTTCSRPRAATNVFADVNRQSIQATSELAMTRAPEVIIEIGVDTASSSGAIFARGTLSHPFRPCGTSASINCAATA